MVQQVILLKQHKIPGNNTILKLEKKKKVIKIFLKKVETNKLEIFKEEDSDIITRVIAETIVKIFELPPEALTGNNFCKRFAIQICKKVS